MVIRVSNPSRAESDHPHKRLHILLSVLAFLVVVGSITLYQVNRINNSGTRYEGYRELTTQERQKILADLEEQFAKSPPLTDSQRDKILEELKNNLAAQNN